ncbi:hypothetical protein H4S14_001885 [Agrobacterium vitis]|nr:hypothetical protein [Agrobacterium vitis]MBE1438140.1 hypothetical protein [Agrobacterium vitis]
MQLETLLQRLTWLRRGWLITAVGTGLLSGLLVPFYLYTAWVQYVVVATGGAGYTGVNGWLVQVMAAWAGPMDRSIIVFEVLGLVLWFGWLWLACRFARVLAPDGRLRFGAFSIAICWFIPVFNVLFVPLALIELANVTMHDPQLETTEAEQSEMVWLAWMIGGLNLVGDGLFFYLTQTSSDAYQSPDYGQSLMHIAATSGVVTLLLLLAMESYIRRLTSAQETRLARLHLN